MLEILKLAKLGYPVIPVADPTTDASPMGKRGKRPISDHGAKDGTTDEATILSWSERFPNCNWGVTCQDLIVLDLDVDETKSDDENFDLFNETVLRYEIELGPIVNTGGGGFHYFFKRTDETIVGQTKIEIDGQKTNIDIRTGDQYVVAVGSKHESGRFYTESKPFCPIEELPKLPQSFLDVLPRKRKPEQKTEISPIVWPTLPPAGDKDVDRARKYIDALPPSIEGQNGSSALLTACNAVLWGFGLDEYSARQLIGAYNTRADPEWSDKEITHKFNEVFAKPPEKPFGWLRDTEKKNAPVDPAVDRFIENKSKSVKNDTEKKTPCGSNSGLNVRKVGEVELEAPRWLWKNRIPLGELTFICGRGSSGKSSLVTDWMARVSSGKEWPDGEKNIKGTVLYYTSEESFKMSIAPKAKLWGADNDNLQNIESVRTTSGDIMFSLEEIEYLENYIMEVNANPEMDNVRMVVFDPITGALGDLNENKNSDVRNILKPLTDLAAKYEIAVVGILHPRKGGINDTSNVVDIVAGSSAFTNVPRLVFEVSVDNDRTRRMLLMKSNLPEPPKGLSFCFTEPIDRPELTKGKIPYFRLSDIVYQELEITTTAEEYHGSKTQCKNESKTVNVRMWLKDYLSEGEQPIDKEMKLLHSICVDGKKSGFGYKTLLNASKQLFCETVKIGDKFCWKLPLQKESEHFGEK